MSHKILRRVLSAVLCAAMISGSCPVVFGAEKELHAVVPTDFTGGKRVLSPQTISCSTPYVSKAAFKELDGIITYMRGEDPTADKLPEEPGQNTKSNVALSIIDTIKFLRPLRRFRLELVPYEGNTMQLVAFYKDAFDKEETCYETGWLYDYDREFIYTVDGTGMYGIGYDFNFDFNEFFSADDPWQRNFGFCKGYDSLAFLIGDYVQTIRVPFTYDDRDWMIQIWKGIYSWNMLGAEIGVYTKPLDRNANFYDCATDSQRLDMSFSVYWGDEEIIATEEEPSWWQTAFTVHKLTCASNLTLCCTIVFPDKEMMKAFSDSLAQQAPEVKVQTDGLRMSICWN